MSPIKVELVPSIFINYETLAVGEKRIKSLGGNEGIKVERIETDPGDEVYTVDQIDLDDPDRDLGLQRLIISVKQPTGHFYVDDARVSVKFRRSSLG